MADTTPKLRIRPMDGRQYAFGLDWQSLPAGSLRSTTQARRASLSSNRRAAYYYIVTGIKQRRMLGDCVPGDAVHGKLYSYAATLAANGGQGVYAAPTDDGYLWYCIVRDGAVVPGTDTIGEPESARAKIREYCSLLEIEPGDIHVSDGVDLGADVTTFDPAALARHARRPVAMRRYSSTAPVAITACVVLAAILLAGGYWEMAGRNTRQHRLSMTQAQRHAQIVAYENAARTALAGYPLHVDWAERAWQHALHALPIYFSGWVLHTLQCTPRGCVATYSALRKFPGVAITPFQARYGAERVVANAHTRSLEVHLPQHYATPNPGWLNTVLHHPPRARMNPQDWIGMARGEIYGTTRTPTLTTLNLAASRGGQRVGYPPLFLLGTSVAGHSNFKTALQAATAWGAEGGFRVTQFTVKPGFGSSQDTWKLKLSAIHG